MPGFASMSPSQGHQQPYMPSPAVEQPKGEVNPLASMMSSVFASMAPGADPMAARKGGSPDLLTLMGSPVLGSRGHADPTASNPTFIAVGKAGRPAEAVPMTFGGPPMIELAQAPPPTKCCLCW